MRKLNFEKMKNLYTNLYTNAYTNWTEKYAIFDENVEEQNFCKRTKKALKPA